jgi:hypothetical protein
VNFFQPSFKLLSKIREGAKVIKKYHPPATPCERLLERKDVSDECKDQLRQTLAALDPVRLLSEIREAQRVLAQVEVAVANAETAQPIPGLSGFVASLTTVWRNGEVRPTHRKRNSGPRNYRTRVDPFEAVWPRVQLWLNEQPDANAKDLFIRLQESTPGTFPPGQLRTLQRRVKQWRGEIARQLVLGLASKIEIDRQTCAARAGVHSEARP